MGKSSRAFTRQARVRVPSRCTGWLKGQYSAGSRRCTRRNKQKPKKQGSALAGLASAKELDMQKKAAWGVATVAVLLSSLFVITGNSATVPVFDGKSLSGWQVRGGADWRTAGGQIVGTAKGSGGGWLVLDH